MSPTPPADTTSKGYCANTGARKSWLAAAGRVAGIGGFMVLASGPSGGRSGEACGLSQAEYAVHPLHGAPRRTFVEIVDDAHDSDGPTVRHSGQMCVVAGGNFLHTR